MKVLIIGNGGREHALAQKLSESARVEQIYVAPGNGGTARVAKCANVDIPVSDLANLAAFAAKNGVSVAIPGPEQPLVDGVTDVLERAGVKVFGPSKLAARMEGSKAFSKEFMLRHAIPTAKSGNFTDFEQAKAYVLAADHKLVLKVSGLAAGKGVLMPESKEEAVRGLEQIMVAKEFGSAGSEVVIEECLEGDEISVLALSDGYTVRALPAAQDHKRALDGDKGPNTGGMGAYAPAPVATPALMAQIQKEVLEPSIKGMRLDGFPFKGVLFVGLMLTASGPKVLEYNVRFGDPETQCVLQLIETDFAEIVEALVDNRLDSVEIKVRDAFCACVVMAAGGYPAKYACGDVITINKLPEHVQVFHAGTKIVNNELVTAGGRVLAVSAYAPSIRAAIDLAYKGVEQVGFKNAHFRKDIAHRAFREVSAPSVTYEQAGVSVDLGNQFVEQIKARVGSTRRPGADASIGGFGGLFDLKAAGYADPLLVSATDGVGTKLMIAQSLDKHDTVGIDLVAMNVNDLVVQGAEPLFFLDYFASGRLVPSTAASFVSGVAEGCIDAGCALVGGETAEMPGLYAGKDYDCNGTSVGAVERDQVLPKIDEMKAGDVVLGLASSGVHSNGFSLVRKILEVNNLDFHAPCPWDSSTSVGLSLLTPTKIYVKSILKALKASQAIRGFAHITGGGLVENVPRVLPAHLDAEIDISSWELSRMFKWLVKAGNVPHADAAKTLNMGIGMVVVVSAAEAEKVLQIFSERETVYRIGTLVEGSGRCVIPRLEAWY